MKKYILIALVSFFVVSCDDFLTLSPSDQLTIENYWRDEEDALHGLAAAYSMVENASGAYDFHEVKYTVEAFREDLYELGSDVYNYDAWASLYNFTYRADNSQFTIYWEYNYKGIACCNQVLEKVGEMGEEKIDPKVKNQILAEANFLRGYYHMTLLLNFEKIIWIEKRAQSESELYNPLVERTVAWDNIIKDFDRAIELNALPKKGSQKTAEKGRATLETVHAYRAYAYLNRASEESGKKEAYLREAEKSLKAEIYSDCALVEDYLSMFNGTNKNSSESLFEVQFTKDQSGGASYKHYLPSFIAIGEMGGWDEIVPGQKLVNEFKKETNTNGSLKYDKRFYATMFFDDPYFDDYFTEQMGSKTSYKDIVSDKTPCFRKYLPYNMDEIAKSSDINVPAMRYSNVLLMRAEVNNELGNTSAAIADINEVRQIHGDMKPMQGSNYEDVKAQIEHERMLEFPLEAYRFYDLRRWGKLEEALAGRGFTKAHSFYPVPSLEVNGNSSVKK